MTLTLTRPGPLCFYLFNYEGGPGERGRRGSEGEDMEIWRSGEAGEIWISSDRHGLVVSLGGEGNRSRGVTVMDLDLVGSDLI